MPERGVIALLCILGFTASGAAQEAGNTALPPDPVQWESEPHARVSDAIAMAAQQITSPGGVEYLFTCTSGPGHDSGWQEGRTYTDVGLEPRTEYAYTVRARDKASGQDIAPPSRPVSVTTRAAVRGPDVESTHVEAIDKALASGELEMIPLMVTGDKDNRINIVFINRWQDGQRDAYNKPELRTEFIEDAWHVLRAFTRGNEDATDPYPSYRNFFNVYAVWWPGIPPWNPEDREAGMHWADYNEIRARLFLPWQIEGKGWVTHLAVLNGGGGGGGAGLREDERVGDAMIVGNEIDGFIHEFNHTAPGIPDEYTSSGLWGRGGEGSTTTNDSRRESVKWRAWVDPDTPVPTPYARAYLGITGVFEGGVHRMAHLFRPTARGCLMGSGSFAGDPTHMCVVCQQRAVQRFYRWVDPIERTTPSRKELALDGPATVRFAVKRVAPDPDTQKTQWRLNGRVIARGRDEVEVAFGALAEYELAFSLVDETPFVRHDPPHARYPRAEVRWQITNAEPSSTARPLQVTLEERSPVFTGVDDGALGVAVAGGRPPYEFSWSDGPTVRDREQLGPGTYVLTVTDAEFRNAETTVTLARDAEIEPSLVSERQGDRWRITVAGIGGHPVTCRWSNGARGSSIRGVSDGRYSCVIRHDNGSRVSREVTLLAPAEPPSAEVERVTASSGGDNDGTVSLSVRGGRPPYTFIWSDGVRTADPERHFLPPADYAVVVRDANCSQAEAKATVAHRPGFTTGRLRFEKAGPGTVRIADPQQGYRYLWYAEDHPPHLPRYPHGIYTGTFTAADGRVCEAEAFVIQNKGGMFVDEREDQNDFGHWIYLMAYLDGRGEEPMVVQVNTRQEGRLADELVVAAHTDGDTTWDGAVADGRLHLDGTGPAGGTFDLLFSSHPATPDRPLHAGTEFSPSAAGNYYVAAQEADTGAVSRNRVGVAITVGPEPERREPVPPDEVTSAKLLMWLDASDMDGDGQEDGTPPRRGAVMGWQGKAGDVDFRDFVFYQPNRQNGKGIASWETIWIQNLSAAVSGYQTAFMVRREHDLSSAGTAPWRDLNGLMGVGEYGKQLMSGEASDEIRTGAVYVNGSKVDPFAAPMPEGFYVATYESSKQMSRGFRTTDGHYEGAVAECVVYDGKLSEAERKGVEEYLRRKWISAVHLEGAPRATGPASRAPE